MNYKQIYKNIIVKAQSEHREKHCGIYYEEHHIKPKCLGGADITKNKVLLTPREHYVCHKLLTFMYKGNRGIALAFHRMTYSKKYGKAVSSRDYAYATELFKTTPVSEITKQKHKDWNKIFYSKKENRDKCSQPGEKNGMYGKESPKKGKPLSNKTKELIKQNTKLAMKKPEVIKKLKDNLPDRHKENNSFFGKHHSEKTIRIIKEKKRKYIIPIEIVNNIKKKIKTISFKELQLLYPQYNGRLLVRIIDGEYDKGYYEAKSK